MRLPRGFEKHPPIDDPTGKKVCGGKDVGRNRILAARETTDVLQLDFSGCLGPHAAGEKGLSLMLTFGYALRRSGAQLLELDPREIGVLVVPAGEGGTSWAPALYDNVPGGAGHVRQLLGQGRDWLFRTRDALYVSKEHDSRCETACLDCLLAFDSQMAAASRPFARRDALRHLDRQLDAD
jgi:hypothetical protein